MQRSSTPEPIKLEIIRLERFTGRIHSAVAKAVQLRAVFETFNVEGNPLRSNDMPKHVGAWTCNALMDALVWELVLIISRLFDQPHRDRASIPSVAKLLRSPAVQSVLAVDYSWRIPDGAPDPILPAIGRIHEAADRLAKENPNRCGLLRDFRNEFLAHQLELDGDRPRPEYRYIGEIVDEAALIAEDLVLAVRGASVQWDGLAEYATASSNALWSAIAAGAMRQA